jgi:hypothetical protein
VKWDLYKKDYKQKEKEIWNIEKIQELDKKTLSVKKWSEINEYKNIEKNWKRYQWDEPPMRF